MIVIKILLCILKHISLSFIHSLTHSHAHAHTHTHTNRNYKFLFPTFVFSPMIMQCAIDLSHIHHDKTVGKRTVVLPLQSAALWQHCTSQNCSTSTAVCSTMTTHQATELKYTAGHRTEVHPLQSAALWQHSTSQNCSTSTAVCSTMTTKYVIDLQYTLCSLQYYNTACQSFFCCFSTH